MVVSETLIKNIGVKILLSGALLFFIYRILCAPEEMPFSASSVIHLCANAHVSGFVIRIVPKKFSWVPIGKTRFWSFLGQQTFPFSQGNSSWPHGDYRI